MLAAPALAQMKRAPFVMASAPSHNFAIAPRWQSTIPQAALKTCVTRATLGSTVIASGTISGWHTGLSARNDMVVAAMKQVAACTLLRVTWKRRLSGLAVNGHLRAYNRISRNNPGNGIRAGNVFKMFFC